jgi:tetratricopeptide (TPR) repeat protein
LYFARRYEEAVAQYKRMIEMNEEAHPSYEWLIRTLEAQGNEPEAFEWFLKLLALRKADNETIQMFKTAYQRSGWKGVLLERERRSDGNVFRLAGYNARLGNKDKAFEYLERSYQQHLGLMATLQVEPQLDPLRDDPRFDELVKRVEMKSSS